MVKKSNLVYSEHCHVCDGTGILSDCCMDEVFEGRCEVCGKSCTSHPCDTCFGEGIIEYHVGDVVDIFVTIYSEEYVKEQLYNPKDVNDTKTFQGKIIKFENHNDCIVEINNKNVKLKIEDISIG